MCSSTDAQWLACAVRARASVACLVIRIRARSTTPTAGAPLSTHRGHRRAPEDPGVRGAQRRERRERRGASPPDGWAGGGEGRKSPRTPLASVLPSPSVSRLFRLPLAPILAIASFIPRAAVVGLGAASSP